VTQGKIFGVTDGPAPTRFFDRTYDEAYSLLVEARSYVRHGASVDSGGLSGHDRLRFALESMRVTSRLGQVMAWLLTEKAVHAGEISRDEATADSGGLSGHRVCLDDRRELSEGMPPQLSSLLDRSLALYVRVARLDEMTRRPH